MARFIFEDLTFEQATAFADWYRDRGEADLHEYLKGSNVEAPIPSLASNIDDNVVLYAQNGEI